MLKMPFHYLQKMKKRILKRVNHLGSWLQVTVTLKCCDKAGRTSGLPARPLFCQTATGTKSPTAVFLQNPPLLAVHSCTSQSSSHCLEEGCKGNPYAVSPAQKHPLSSDQWREKFSQFQQMSDPGSSQQQSYQRCVATCCCSNSKVNLLTASHTT